MVCLDSRVFIVLKSENDVFYFSVVEAGFATRVAFLCLCVVYSV